MNFATSTSLLQLPSQHVSVLHGPARSGMVTVATREGGWRECTVPVEDLQRYIATIPLGQDVFLSQARFRGRRAIVNVVHLNALWVDIDFYRVRRSWTAADALYALLGACDGASIPPPSYVLGTGRGLAAVWLCEVLPGRAVWRWNAAERALIQALLGLGADTAAHDCSRVLRLAGTLNTRAAKPALVRCLYPQVGTPEVHGFEDLCAALLPYDRPARKRSARARPPRAVPSLRLVGANNAAQLWVDRLGDLRKLWAMRYEGALPPGRRDLWLLLASCALAWMSPPDCLRREVLELARDATARAWTDRAIETDMGAVLRRAEAAGRGERVEWQGVELDPRYRYRTGTILERLEVTLDEQRSMRTLIGSAERARRRSAHQRERGARGGVASGESRRAVELERDAAIVRLRQEQGLSQRVIAHRLGTGRQVVRGVLARLAPAPEVAPGVGCEA